MRRAWCLLLVVTACDALPPELRAVQRAPSVVESCDPAPDVPDDGMIVLSRPALPPGTRYEVLPGVQLSSHVAARLARLDDEFARRTRGRHLIIVSGTRDSMRQARAMFDVMRHGGNLLKLYEDRDSALEVKQAHDRAVAARRPTSEVIAAMQGALRAQIERGVYLSAHLRAGAVDVRSTTMSAADRKMFKAIVQDADDIRLLEEQHPPHFHLQID